MPTKSRCFTPVRGKVARVTQLDGCGNPIYGDDTSVVTDGITTVNFTANVEEGEEINLTNFAGQRCAYVPACPSLLGYELEIEFCRVDPALFAMLTNQTVIYDADTGDAIGFKICSDVDNCSGGFALELWTGSTQTGDDCDPGTSATAEPVGYLLAPFLQGGTFGDFTLENDAVTFTVTGAATKDGSHWGTGPYPIEFNPETGAYGPLRSTSVVTCDHMVIMSTTTTPPTPYCGPVPTLDPSGAPVTDLIIGSGATDLAVTFAPDPAGTDPFWVDFGDGEWDYSEDGTSLEHEYASPGVYTVTIYRGSSMYTEEIQVPLDVS